MEPTSITIGKHTFTIHISESAGPSVSVDGRSWGPMGEAEPVGAAEFENYTDYAAAKLAKGPVKHCATCGYTELLHHSGKAGRFIAGLCDSFTPESEPAPLAEALAADPLLGSKVDFSEPIRLCSTCGGDGNGLICPVHTKGEYVPFSGIAYPTAMAAKPTFAGRMDLIGALMSASVELEDGTFSYAPLIDPEQAKALLLGTVENISSRPAQGSCASGVPNAGATVAIATSPRPPCESAPTDQSTEVAELTALARAYPATQKSEVALKFIARGNLDAARGVLEGET